jgi:hypothetical protein
MALSILIAVARNPRKFKIFNGMVKNVLPDNSRKKRLALNAFVVRAAKRQEHSHIHETPQLY